MENENSNPKPESGIKFPIGDLWPKTCSQCGDETETDSEFVVFTAKKGERKHTGVRQYSTPYILIQEHPCRVCEACEKEHTTRGFNIPCIFGILGSILIFLWLWERRGDNGWLSLTFASLLLGSVLFGLWNNSVNKNRQQKTADKAALARGAGYIGLTKASLEEIIKSKDTPIYR